MDVIVLEKVYDQLRNHIPAKTHFGKVFKQGRGSCPECGSEDLVVKCVRYTASGTPKNQYQCNVCHKYHTKTEK